MVSKTCGKIKTNGTTCGMVALKDQSFCYYHQRERQRFGAIDQSSDHRRRAQSAGTPDPVRIQDISEDLFVKLQLPSLDDPASIQVCYTMVIQAAATGQISRRMAGTLFYGLFLAKQNLDAARADLRKAEYEQTADSDPKPIYSGNPFLDTEHTPLEKQPDFAKYFQNEGKGKQEPNEDRAAPKGARPVGGPVPSPKDDTSVARHVSAGDGNGKKSPSPVGAARSGYSAAS